MYVSQHCRLLLFIGGGGEGGGMLQIPSPSTEIVGEHTGITLDTVFTNIISKAREGGWLRRWLRLEVGR